MSKIYSLIVSSIFLYCLLPKINGETTSRGEANISIPMIKVKSVEETKLSFVFRLDRGSLFGTLGERIKTFFLRNCEAFAF